MDYLHALQLRLSRQRGYLRVAKADGERQLRAVWISQIEKEIRDQRKFLGLPDEAELEMTDDEILAELMA